MYQVIPGFRLIAIDFNEDFGDVGSGGAGDLEKQYDPETEDPIKITFRANNCSDNDLYSECISKIIIEMISID